MKKETMEKIVNTAVETMCSGLTRHIDRINVNFDTAKSMGLAGSLSNIIVYQDCRFSGYKEDIIITYTDYDNSLNLYVTMHNAADRVVLGYRYCFCVRMNGKNQIEIACELCQALAMLKQDIKY